VIEIVFRGRLGNQMFQYAYGLTLAARRGVKLGNDLRWYYRLSRPWRRSALPPEDFQLWRFAGTGLKPLTTAAEVAGRLLERLPGRKRLPDYTMNDSRFEPAALELADGHRLNGWFQSLRYFEEQADTVRRHYDLTPFQPVADLAAYRAQAAGRPLVALHVRRGDYVGNPDFSLGDYDGYYARALQIIDETLGAPPFLVVVSDDPAWCRQWPLLAGRAHSVFDPGPRLALVDMALMAACDHNIITNSSFSWWAAWLGAPQDRRVVMPDHWYPGRTTDSCDMNVPGWVQA
jgi:hypothetical protein